MYRVSLPARPSLRAVVRNSAKPAQRTNEERTVLSRRPMQVRLTAAEARITSPAMAIREIIILPDKQLRLVSKPVEKVTAQVRKLADDMFETMYAAPGIGLAAIQVAEPLRLITMDLAKREENGETTARPRVFINPEILSSSEEVSVYEEGCLSIPDYY